MAALKLFLTVALLTYSVQAASFSDLTSETRTCDTYSDCEKNECCVVSRRNPLNGLVGKRELLDDLFNGFLGALSSSNDTTPDNANVTTTDGPLVDMTNSTQGGSATPPPSSGGLGGLDILGLLGKLGGLQNTVDEANKKKKEALANLMKHMSDKNHIGSFLDSFNSRPAVKRGVCKSLSQEGEACVNYLNGPVCPCGDNLDCKSSPDAKFSGFGAINGLHNLRCAAL